MSDATHASGPSRGHLILRGGGEVEQGEPTVARFVELLGGADQPVVYIPTASPDFGLSGDFATGLTSTLKAHGLTNVTILHTRDRTEADSATFVEPIRASRGVWIGGGRHCRLADAYLHTRTHEELSALLQRGGVVAGGSAGATIQGSYLIRGDSYAHDPDDKLPNLILMGDHEEGFGFLSNTVIDQHVLARNRLFDIPVVQEEHPDLLGLGIDEHTAIVVSGEQFEVVGKSYVAVYDGTSWSEDRGKVTDTDEPFYLLGHGKRYDLRTGEIFEPEDGQLSSESAPCASPDEVSS